MTGQPSGEQGRPPGQNDGDSRRDHENDGLVAGDVSPPPVARSAEATPAVSSSGRLAWLPFTLIFVALALAVAFGLPEYLSLEAIIGKKAALTRYAERHGLLAILVFMVLYVAVATFSIPGALPMTLMGGLFFGPYIGGAAAVLAATSGAVVLFLAARSAVGKPLRERVKGLAARIADGFQRDAISYMLFMRLVPAFPFVLVNLLPALFNVRLWPFLWTTVLGIVPGTFAFAHVGAGLGHVLDLQHEHLTQCRAAGRIDCAVSLDPAQLLDRNLMLAFIAVGVLALTPLLARKVFGAKGVALPGPGDHA